MRPVGFFSRQFGSPSSFAPWQLAQCLSYTRASGRGAGRIVARPREQHRRDGDRDADRGGAADERRPPEPHSLTPRSRSAFPITDTDERLIAALAIIGLRSSASQG